MDYVFTGFHQTDTVRHYDFQGVEADRTRTRIIVDADVELLRKHSIPLQEVPLICKRLLESSNGTGSRRIIFTEAHMRSHADAQVAQKQAAAQKRRVHRSHIAKEVE